MKLATLEDLFVHELKDIYSAEKQLTEALPKMVAAAHDKDLKQAFQHHLEQTQQHMQVVNELLSDLGKNPGSTVCDGMEGLIEEGKSIIKTQGNADALDAALIVSAQKVEHYEIASYGSLHTFAKTLGYDKAAQKLQMVLDEEYAADQKLDDIAMGVHQRAGLNAAAKA